MPGTTTKLALYLPGGGSSGLITPDEQLDVDKINDNMKKIDLAAGFIVCTSGTRPATPFAGQNIVETDTRNTMYWTGARWAPLDSLPNAASAIIRDVLYPTPVAGNQVFRTDIGTSGTIQEYNGGIWKSQTAGLVPLTVSTVFGAGATKNGNGEIFMSSAATCGLGQFATAEFDNYRVVGFFTTASASQPIVQLLDNTNTAITATSYGTTLTYNNALTPTVVQNTLQNYWQLAVLAGVAHKFTLDVFSLGTAGFEKGIISTCSTGAGSGTYTQTSVVGGTSNTLALAGLYFGTVGGQPMFGRLRAYGWNNGQ